MGCYYGFATEGGAEGVGMATTRAVVASCVLVLISDYVLANVLFRFIFANDPDPRTQEAAGAASRCWTASTSTSRPAKRWW